MFKRFIRNKFVIWCLSWVVAGIIASIMITTRWKTVNRQLADEILNNHNGFVLILWHERIFAVPWLWPRRHPMYVLQSPHADGQLMSYSVNRMGIRTVWGSSNRNAISGLRGLKRSGSRPDCHHHTRWPPRPRPQAGGWACRAGCNGRQTGCADMLGG